MSRQHALESTGVHYSPAAWRSETGGYVGHATWRDEYGMATTSACGHKHRTEADTQACIDLSERVIAARTVTARAFDLGRMRHLDLLALWHERHPDAHLHARREIGRLSGDALAALLLSTA